MMIFNEAYTLANGMSIPKLGLGTWFIDDDKAAEAVGTSGSGTQPPPEEPPAGTGEPPDAGL